MKIKNKIKVFKNALKGIGHRAVIYFLILVVSVELSIFFLYKDNTIWILILIVILLEIRFATAAFFVKVRMKKLEGLSEEDKTKIIGSVVEYQNTIKDNQKYGFKFILYSSIVFISILNLLIPYGIYYLPPEIKDFIKTALSIFNINPNLVRENLINGNGLAAAIFYITAVVALIEAEDNKKLSSETQDKLNKIDENIREIRKEQEEKNKLSIEKTDACDSNRTAKVKRLEDCSFDVTIEDENTKISKMHLSIRKR